MLSFCQVHRLISELSTVAQGVIRLWLLARNVFSVCGHLGDLALCSSMLGGVINRAKGL